MKKETPPYNLLKISTKTFPILKIHLLPPPFLKFFPKKNLTMPYYSEFLPIFAHCGLFLHKKEFFAISIWVIGQR